MKRFWISLLLCLFLTACSAPTPVGVDSSSLEPFVIGGIAPLTEEFAAYGISAKNGARLAVDEINATGGVNGFRLVLNFQDSKASPETALTVYEKLKANDMNVLLSGIVSEEAKAISQAAAKDGILVLCPSAAEKDVLQEGGTSFRICPDATRLGTSAANFLAEKKMGTSIAVVYREDSFGGKTIAESFLAACTAREIQATPLLLTEEPAVATAEEGDTEEESPLLFPEDEAYDILFLALSSEDTAEFLRDYPEASARIFACNEPTTGTPPEEFTLISSYFPEDKSPLNDNFAKTYTETFQAAPDRYAAEAYDAVYAVAEAIKRAGVTPGNVEDKETNVKLIDAMTKIEVHGVTGTMSWTPDGETTRPPTIRIFRNGAYESFESNENAQKP